MNADDRLRKRARIIKAIRGFFDDQEFVEVDTWVAITAPAPEPHIETVAVGLQTPTEISRRFLQPSPEMQMKRILVQTPRIYQIAPVFRQGDLSPQHRPEFRMLEWYRRGASWIDLLDDCEGLLRACALAAAGTTMVGGVDLAQPFLRMSMEEAFLEHVGFSILEAIDRPTLQYRLRQRDIHFSEDDTWNDLFHRVFLSRVEPKLVLMKRPYFLYDYPAPLQMYAQLSQRDPRACERFELYAGAMELANGYGEIVCPENAHLRFNADANCRERARMQRYPVDERFFEALEHLPASAGIAMGVERLLMLMMNETDIDNIVAIPWSLA